MVRNRSDRKRSDRRAHWLRLFLPFAVGYYLSYLLRNANAVIAPELTRELSLTAANLGLLTSVYFFAFGAFQVPLGMLLDRFGARRVEATLLLFAAAGTLIFGFGRDIAELSLGRALIGVGVSACLMAGLKQFSQWYPLERQSSLTGAIMTAGSLGAISASVPLEWLLPVFGWRGVFQLLTIVIVAAAIYLFFAVPDRNEKTEHATVADQWRGVVHIFASRDFWRFAPLMTLFSGGFMAIQGLWIVPWFINVYGVTREVAAQNLFVMGIASLVSFFAIAIFSTRLIRAGIKPTFLVGGVLAISWCCLALVVVGVPVPLTFLVVYSFCSATTTLMYAALGTYFAPGLYGRVSTALNLMAFVGAFCLQWGLGGLVDRFTALQWSSADAFRAAFAVVVALQLLSWIWFVLEGRRHAAAAGMKAIPPMP